MKNFVVMLIAFFTMLSSPSWAAKCTSAETVPVAEIEALIKAGMYEPARLKLEKVVADCPDSYKARQYLYQVYGRLGLNNKVDTKAQSPAEVKAQKEEDGASIGFMVFLLMVLVIIPSGLAVYIWWSGKRKLEKHREDVAKRDLAVKDEIYTEVLALREELEDLIIELEVDNRASTEYKNNLKDARAISTDLVEICYKNVADLDVNKAKSFLRDAHHLIQQAPNRG